MFRFAFRDLIWFTIVLGLVVVWTLEMKRQQRESAELNRLQIIQNEQATELQKIEDDLLDKNQKEAGRSLADWARQRGTKQQAIVPRGGPSEALFGEWEIVDLIEQGKAHDLQGQPTEWIKFARGRIGFSQPSGGWDWYPCTINARQINVSFSSFILKDKDFLPGLYELRDGKLRIVWPDDVGKPPPTNFDALNDKQLSLYVLTKKLE
jgi:hypothetical protein